MALSEKTLELNITYELLTVADRLHSAFHTMVMLSGHPLPAGTPKGAPAVAVGLSLNEEKRKGWDVRIELPNGYFGRRCTFIQYKLAKHRNYSRNIQSKFTGSRANRNPHCVFGINNNSDCDQHILLRSLSKNPDQSDAVYYALPRISSPQSFRRWAGHLSDMTSWYTIPTVDSVASAGGQTIQTGTPHELRTDYHDNTRELRSEPIDISALRDVGPELIAEIVAVRAWRVLVEWIPYARSYRVPAAEWSKAFHIYLQGLMRHWGAELEISRSLTFLQRDPGEMEFLIPVLETADELGVNRGQLLEVIQQRRRAVRGQIRERLRPLTTMVDTGAWLEEPLPEPRATRTLNLGSTEGLVRMAPDERRDPKDIDWTSISFQVI